MKSRRLTVGCMAAIALIGTPRAWQEIGNLLEVAQQKAQMKFWSMVMQPADPDVVELVAADEPAPERDDAPCPGNRKQARENLVAVSYREPLRQRASARRQRTQAGAHGLIAHARRMAPAGERSVERALRLDGLRGADFYFSEVAENIQAPRPARGARPVPHQRAAPPDTLSFVQLPAIAPVALREKEAACQFRLLKKALHENKILLRQKGRFPAVRVNTSARAS